MTCAHCGALVGPGTGRCCEHCGALLPGARRTHADQDRAHPERYRRVRGDARYARAMAFDPTLPPGRSAVIAGIVVLVAGAVAFALTLAYSPGAALWVGVAAAVGVAICAVARYRELHINDRPLVRVVAVVVDKRTEVVGGRHHASAGGRGYTHAVETRYGTTLELETGQRFELETFGALAARVAPGDVGVAYTRDGYLIGFDRFPA